MADLDDQEKQHKAQALFEALSNPEISPEKMDEIKGQLQADKSLLTSYGFTALLDMPHLSEQFGLKDDKEALLKQSIESQQKLKVVLDNLQKIDFTKTDENAQQRKTDIWEYSDGDKQTSVELPSARTAAEYFLNNAHLANGETVGTQMVKNIHFLGTLDADKAYKLSDNEEQNNALREQVQTHLGESVQFYKNLYTSYGANKDAHNLSGQKADDLMKTCLKDKKQQLENGASVEKVQKAVFMAAPHKATIVEAELAKYLGKPLTVEQQQLLNDKKEAELANLPDQNRKYDGRDKKGDKFKDEDMVKYMYEEIFLAFMSWGCDKLEEGVEIIIDAGTDWLNDCYTEHKRKTATANPKLKDVLAKVSAFEKNLADVLAQQKVDMTERMKKDQKVADILSKIRDFSNIDEQSRKQLSELLGEEGATAKFAECRAHPEKAQTYQNQPKADKMIDTVERLAMQLTGHEMIDEVMRSDKAWRDSSGQYLSDSALIGSDHFQKRMQARRDEMYKAIAAQEDDCRLRIEAEYAPLSYSDKKKWIQENIVDAYQKRIDSPETPKECLKECKENRDRVIKTLKSGNMLSDAEVLKTYATLEVNTYLGEVAELGKKARQKQKQWIDENRFDAIGQAPDASVKKLIESADAKTQGLLDQVKVGTKADKSKQKDEPKSLEEEASAQNQPMPAEKMATTSDGQLSTIESEKRANQERKNQYNQRINRSRYSKNERGRNQNNLGTLREQKKQQRQ